MIIQYREILKPPKVMKTIEKKYIEEEYTSKKPFTILVCSLIAFAWLFAIVAICYVVNAVITFTFDLFGWIA